ncbi:SIR2 family NAD-dependent protein deacylase [Pectobacterium versatile]|uniref:SIR2 family NAD-dependent protein deacylase n=1 Tax=Pectobacterium versatile TaxID=2488639 RepID=UPI0020BD4AED|nr:SIR2 family protein [Pectobacterium versatile]
MNCIEKLTENSKAGLLSAIHTNNYFFWVGSGFSYNFGFCSWGDVLKKIRKEINYPLSLNVGNPLKAAELLYAHAVQQHGYDEYKFNSLVASSLLSLKKETTPNWIKEFIKYAPNIIVTTNWDDQLESIFDYLPNVIVRKDKIPQVSNGGRNIFKIHGDIGRPDSIVVTQSQYFSFQREDTYLNRKIYTLFSEASPVFMGYSLTDPNISFLYDEVYAHLGESKPPAYMIVHPTVNETELREFELLFKDKNIHIIKAEIGVFLNDLNKSYVNYKKSTNRFFDENKNIKARLQKIIDLIISKKEIISSEILTSFKNNDSRKKAAGALIEILSNQLLYGELGGELLSPENRASYREIDRLVNAIITITNESHYPSLDVREKFYASVMELCANSDGVWDFNSAREPFSNILRISPKSESIVFKGRIKHIIGVLRWSAPRQIGKCWATWDEFCKKISWLSEEDIDAIIDELEYGENKYKEQDDLWLKKIFRCDNCNNEQKNKILMMIEGS